MSLVVLNLKLISRSAGYWIVVLTLCLAMMAVALFYQHILHEPPCSLCIHARLWVLVLTVVSLFGLLGRGVSWVNPLMHSLVLVASAGLLERSYQLLGTERGFVFSECSLDLGLPAWLALDRWFPPLFQAETLCGYTPELLFGITFAEALTAFSVIAVVISLLMLGASLRAKP